MQVAVRQIAAEAEQTNAEAWLIAKSSNYGVLATLWMRQRVACTSGAPPPTSRSSHKIGYTLRRRQTAANPQAL
jgi:hypothetical protein